MSERKAGILGGCLDSTELLLEPECLMCVNKVIKVQNIGRHGVQDCLQLGRSFELSLSGAAELIWKILICDSFNIYNPE